MRPARLKQLQKMPYGDYLESPEWDAVRKRAYALAEYRCQLCNKDGELHTHHRSYDRIGCEKDCDVIVLCKRCHGKFHGANALMSIKEMARSANVSVPWLRKEAKAKRVPSLRMGNRFVFDENTVKQFLLKLAGKK